MKRALLTAVVMVTWALGASANAFTGAGADGLQRTDHVQASRQADEPAGSNTASRRVARDDSIRWSEPFYRYGHREPALEELTRNGKYPGSGSAALVQPRQ